MRGSGRKRDYCQYHDGPTCGSPGCSPLNCERVEPGLQMTPHDYPAWFLRKKAKYDMASIEWITAA